VNRHGLDLRYRQGYYAGPDSGRGPATKKQELEAELLNRSIQHVYKVNAGINPRSLNRADSANSASSSCFLVAGAATGVRPRIITLPVTQVEPMPVHR